MTVLNLFLASIAATALALAPAKPVTTCCQIPTAEASTSKAGPALERIKALAGTWVRIGEDGEPTDEIVSQSRVTAGGSAVIETLFPGTDHEMITLYYVNGDDLVLTHYCVLGNQPHMRATTIEDKKIVFTCDDTGVSSADEAHMHLGTLTWLGKDRMTTEWRQFTDGENNYTAAFEIVRRK